MSSFLDILIGIGPAIAGGVARYFHDISKKDKEFHWKKFLIQLFIAGFIGWITIAIINDLAYFQGKDQLKGAVVGISSFLSPNLLDIIEDRIPGIIDGKLKRVK